MPNCEYCKNEGTERPATVRVRSKLRPLSDPFEMDLCDEHNRKLMDFVANVWSEDDASYEVVTTY